MLDMPDRYNLPPRLYQRVRMHTVPDGLNLEQRRVHSDCRLLRERYHHHSVPDRFNLHCRRYQLELVYSNCRLLQEHFTYRYHHLLSVRDRNLLGRRRDLVLIVPAVYQLGYRHVRVQGKSWIHSEYNYTGNICLPGWILHFIRVKNIYARVRYIVAATVQIAPTRRPLPSP